MRRTRRGRRRTAWQRSCRDRRAIAEENVPRFARVRGCSQTVHEAPPSTRRSRRSPRAWRSHRPLSARSRAAICHGPAAAACGWRLGAVAAKALGAFVDPVGASIHRDSARRQPADTDSRACPRRSRSRRKRRAAVRIVPSNANGCSVLPAGVPGDGPAGAPGKVPIGT